MKKKEVGLGDVYALVEEFFGFVKSQFEKNERVLQLMGAEVGGIRKETKDLRETTAKVHIRLLHIEQDVLSIREDVETLGKIAGRDSAHIKSHDRRITRLEKAIR